MKLVVYPTARAGRRYIDKQKLTDQLLPKVMTIGELFQKSADIGDKKFIDSTMLSIYLHRAMNFAGFGVLGLKNSFTEQFIKSNEVLNTLTELSHEMVNIDKLSQIPNYGLYDKHIKVLKQVKSNLIELLDTQGYVASINLPQNYNLNLNFVSNYTQVVIHLEGYLSRYEMQIVKDIAKHIHVVLSFCYMSHNRDNIDKFISSELELDTAYKYNLTEDNIISKIAMPSMPNHYKLKAFDSKVDEIAYIKHTIYQAIKSGTKPENIAVVLPDENMAIYMRLFDEDRNFNYAFGFDMKDSKLYQTIDTVNRYIATSYDKQIASMLEFLDIDEEFIKFVMSNYSQTIDKPLLEKFHSYTKAVCQLKEHKDINDDIFYSLYQIISHIDISLKDGIKIFLYMLGRQTIDDTKGGKITVTGLLETRAMEFELVIVCNFNDTLVPKKLQKDKLLNSKTKATLGLPTLTDRVNLQAYYYHMLFLKARRLYISYDQSESGTISSFGKLLLNYDDTPNTHDNYRQILYDTKNFTHYDGEIKLDIDMSARSWSASSLKTYLTCKRKFALSYLYNIKETTNIYKPKAYEVGNILHKALEMTYKTKDNFDDKQELYDTISKNIEQINATNPYITFDILLYKHRLRQFVSAEIWRFDRGIKVKHTEYSFDTVKHGIKINGKIDRVDSLPDGSIDIIDYKSSKEIKVDRYEFQLLFYFMALEELGIGSLYHYNLYFGKLIELPNIDEKMLELIEIFKELKTSRVDFIKCEKLDSCRLCQYKTICQRN